MDMNNGNTNLRENDDSAIDWRSGGELHPAGIWAAVFSGFESFDHEQFGYRVRLKFTTAAEQSNGENHELSVTTSPSLGPKAKIYPLLVALGEDPKLIKPSEFKLSAYLKRKLQLVVEHAPRQDGTGNFAKVVSFQPLPAKSARPKPKFDVEDEDEAAAA